MNSFPEILQEYHQKKFEVNRRRKEEEISTSEAFKQIDKVHKVYWKNEDPYHSPGLSWPCDFDPAVTGDWQVFELSREHRCFLTYSSNKAWKTQFFAYGIDPKARGRKCIINEL